MEKGRIESYDIIRYTKTSRTLKYCIAELLVIGLLATISTAEGLDILTRVSINLTIALIGTYALFIHFLMLYVDFFGPRPEPRIEKIFNDLKGIGLIRPNSSLGRTESKWKGFILTEARLLNGEFHYDGTTDYVSSNGLTFAFLAEDSYSSQTRFVDYLALAIIFLYIILGLFIYYAIVFGHQWSIIDIAFLMSFIIIGRLFSFPFSNKLRETMLQADRSAAMHMAIHFGMDDAKEFGRIILELEEAEHMPRKPFLHWLSRILGLRPVIDPKQRLEAIQKGIHLADGIRLNTDQFDESTGP